MKDILLIEPFYGGSHQQLIQSLEIDKEIGPRCEVHSLPAKKWQWRARTSALYLSQIIPVSNNYRVLFTSSVLNLAELIALRPDLTSTKKIVYFHENQLVYPVRRHQERDFQYGYNQILTSLVADIVVFNSKFNMESFLSMIPTHLKLIPDHRPKNLETQIRPKCRVLYFPLVLPNVPLGLKQSELSNPVPVQNSPTKSLVDRVTSDFNNSSSNQVSSSDENLKESCHINGYSKQSETETTVASVVSEKGKLDTNKDEKENTLSNPKCSSKDSSITSIKSLSTKEILHIVWPHRWEHDKDPDSFFKALLQLQSDGQDFHVSVIGETFSEIPDIFDSAKAGLQDKILAWGYQSKEDYFKILDSAHVVVSTALHEFFGVSVLEAVSHNCYPLCPKRLVYPEIYPEDCLYSTQAQLVKRLKRFCKRPDTARL
ncbi:unnamed protein product, partial [Lymnaea stagnalis]